MRIVILILLLLSSVLTTGCKTMSDSVRPDLSNYDGREGFRYSERVLANMDPKMKERMDKAYSDDTVIVEVYDQEGKKTHTLIGR